MKMLDLNVNPKKLNKKFFEYALALLNGTPIGYVHIKDYLNSMTAYKGIIFVCPICHKIVKAAHGDKRRPYWFNKEHTCYSKHKKKIDNGEFKFNIIDIITKSTTRSIKKPQGIGGGKGPGIKPPKVEGPEIDSDGPILVPGPTNINTARKIYKYKIEGSGDITDANGYSIGDIVCDDTLFKLLNGDLDTKYLEIPLKLCNYKKLPPTEEDGIWLKAVIDDSTYIHLVFKTKINLIRVRKEITHDHQKEDDNITVYVLGQLFRLENNESLNLYEICVENPVDCIWIKRNRENENE